MSECYTSFAMRLQRPVPRESRGKRPRLGQNVDDPAAAGEQRLDDIAVEGRWDIYAAVGYAVVPGCRRLQPLKAMLARMVRNHRVQCDRAGDVDPEYPTKAERRPDPRDEASGRRRTLAGLDVRKLPVANAENFMIALSGADQCRCCAHEDTRAIENEHFRADLVDDHERQTLIVA